jgi:hypothetical protein
VPLTLSLPGPAGAALKGKGALHAAAVPGPWAFVLDEMPPIPLKGRRRAEAGLAGVPLPRSATRSVLKERAARSLVAILPRAAAPFILHISPARAASTPPAVLAADLVANLSGHGASSVDKAYSVLGRLLTWVRKNRPECDCVGGPEVSAWLASLGSSVGSATTDLAWLRDWCGLDLPVRGNVTRPYRRPPPSTSNDTESLNLAALIALEVIMENHPSEFVRGQAAGFWFLMKHALRVELLRERHRPARR